MSWTSHQVVSGCFSRSLDRVGNILVRYSFRRGRNFSISGSMGEDASEVRTASYNV